MTEKESKINKLKEIPAPLIVMGLFLLITIGVLGFEVYLVFTRKEEVEIDNEENGSVVVNEELKNQADEGLAEITGSNNFEKVALVGKEYIFEDDVKNYFASQGLLSNYEDQDQWDKALEVQIQNSMVLQEAEKLGWIELENTFFNNPMKDYNVRGESFLEVRENFNSELLGAIRAEGCAIVFNPYIKTSPYIEKHGLDQAKSVAKQKIEEIYQRVTSGEIDMMEASQIISDDSILQEMNPPGYDSAGLESSSYFVRVFSEYEFHVESDPNIETKEAIKTLKTGEYTPVLLEVVEVQEGSQVETIDSLYVFYRSLDSDRGYNSYEEWLEEMKDSYPVTFF